LLADWYIILQRVFYGLNAIAEKAMQLDFVLAKRNFLTAHGIEEPTGV
jgi:hypothetical protein